MCSKMVCAAAVALMLVVHCKVVEEPGLMLDIDTETNEEMTCSLLQASVDVSLTTQRKVASATLVSPRIATSSDLDDNPGATPAVISVRMYQHVKTLYNMMLETSHGAQQKPSGGPYVPLHSGDEQKRVFAIVCCVLFLLVASILMWCGNKGLHDCPVSILAVISCIGFGVDNFLMAYASCYLKHPSAHAGVKFLFDGISAFGVHCCCMTFRPAYRSQVQDFSSSSGRVLMLTVLTGIFIAFGQLTGNIGFNLDTEASGPHQALACSTVLLVAPFFYYFRGEVLTKLQFMGCFTILAGVVIMSDIRHWFDSLETRYAFQWVFVSMLFYAASVVTWRLAATADTEPPWQPQILMIFGCVGFVGCILCPGYLYADSVREYVQTPALLLWPALNVSVSFLAMWSLQCAFQRPEATAGAITAVVDSNSLVMLAMNRLVLGLAPSFTKTAGMTIILFGCVTVCSEDFVHKSELELKQKRVNT
mmetsp:Transcript_114086/g.207962  ORF Transcript_114086/g.207962 Transcript_114086/m.207962 type:complete len:477 (-) Transcript_114086:216-1646(-)